MSAASIKPPPAGWGTDELSKFLQTAQENQWATFHNLKPAYKILARIDECFMQIAENMLNPKNMLAGLLLFRSHSAYRAGCGAAMAGQVVESFILGRGCLEYAGYGLLIHANAPLGEVWLRRHDNEAAMRAMKKEFTHGNVRSEIETRDSKLASIYDTLYQRAVDFGAHPNERGLTSSMAIEELAGGDKKFLQIYLHSNGLQLAHGLKSTAEIGLCSLHVLQWVFKERFEILGIRERLQELRKAL